MNKKYTEDNFVEEYDKGLTPFPAEKKMEEEDLGKSKYESGKPWRIELRAKLIND